MGKWRGGRRRYELTLVLYLAVGSSGPLPDTETASALAVAGVSQATLRLTGDTFQQFKGEYRKMPKAQRIQSLAQMQMRIAAIYAIENEDMQRQVRMDQQERRHRQTDSSKRQSLPTTTLEKRARRASAMEDGEEEDRAARGSPTRRRTQGLGAVQQQGHGQDAEALQQLEHQGPQMDAQHLLGAQQTQHSPDDVDSFIQCEFLSPSYQISSRKMFGIVKTRRADTFRSAYSAVSSASPPDWSRHTSRRTVPPLPHGPAAAAERSAAGAKLEIHLRDPESTMCYLSVLCSFFSRGHLIQTPRGTASISFIV